MTPGNGEERIHVRGISEGVNGKDCFGFLRDRRFSLSWIHVESDGINIYKDGICSDIANRIGCSDKGERWHNHFFSQSYIQCKDAKVEACSSGAHSNGEGGTRITGDSLLKLFELWA